jgi:hypothetical protein
MSEAFYSKYSHGVQVQHVWENGPNGAQVAQSLSEDKQVFFEKIKSFNLRQIILDKEIAQANSEQNVTLLLECSKRMIQLSDERVAFIEAYANDTVKLHFIYKKLDF